jgi:hypothetical protein
MFLLLNSGSGVQICVDSVVSSSAHTSVVKMYGERKSTEYQVVTLVFLSGEMRGVSSFSSVFFNDAVSCYK